MLPLYLPEKEESDTSKSDEILLTNSVDIFGKSEPKVIKILDSEPEVIIISNTNTILADNREDANVIEEDKLGICALIDSDELLIYSDYSCVYFYSPIKISYIEMVLASKMIIPDNIRILYHPDK